MLLVDERPEEAAAWREALPDAELAIATGRDGSRGAGPGRDARRRAREAPRGGGADAVLICDSLSRLAVAADGTAEVKRLFGSGRELEGDGPGSLTVIATRSQGSPTMARRSAPS